MKEICLRSPAKINLFLRILGKRADGYHEIASLLQAVDLTDTIYFSLQKEDMLTCSNPFVPTDSSNLIMKAANLFRGKTGHSFGIRCHLEKNIPYQAGLGGGSGNAATAFWALNELTGRSASLEQLQNWSSEIGSDIPFFFSEGLAYCTGRGEKAEPVPCLQSQDIWIVKPQEGNCTASVYRNLNSALLQERDPLLFLKKIGEGEEGYFNDLEEAALMVTPSLAGIKRQLRAQGHRSVLLAGSGSAWIVFADPLQQPPDIQGCKVYSAKFISRVPGSWY